jgi:propionyl-CoA synthetase
MDDLINVAGHRLSTGITHKNRKDFIYSHFFNSRVGSIEQIILRHPQIVDCCVIPFPDPLKGHVPFAFIVLVHPQQPIGIILPELIAATRRDLGPIACLSKALVVHALPKTKSGKILRRCLHHMVNPAQGCPLPGTIDDPKVLYAIETALLEEKWITQRVLMSEFT